MCIQVTKRLKRKERSQDEIWWDAEPDTRLLSFLSMQCSSFLPPCIWARPPHDHTAGLIIITNSKDTLLNNNHPRLALCVQLTNTNLSLNVCIAGLGRYPQDPEEVLCFPVVLYHIGSTPSKNLGGLSSSISSVWDMIDFRLD